MKLKKDFITHDTGTESMLVPTGKAAFSGLVRGYRTFVAIVELLKQDTSEAEVIAAMKARYDAPEEIIARDVRKILTELREIGAIEE